MRVRSGKKRGTDLPDLPGRNQPHNPRQLPKMPQRPIAPPRRIPNKGR